MKLICINQPQGKYFKKDSLTLNKEYLVYAMEFKISGLFYYIIDEDHQNVNGCPFWNPYPDNCFSIVDHKISHHWIFNNYLDSENTSYDKKIFAIPEWAINPINFYTKLVDNDPGTIDTFLKYKKYMELEFPNTKITAKALLLKENWLQCSKCNEAWEDFSNLGMVQCENCKEILHNPRYLLKNTTRK